MGDQAPTTPLRSTPEAQAAPKDATGAQAAPKDTTEAPAHESRPPDPPILGDWKQQGVADVAWLREVDPRMDGLLRELEGRAEPGARPDGAYRMVELEASREEARSLFPDEVTRNPALSRMVEKAVDVATVLLGLVDRQFTRGEGALPPVNGTVWKEMPAAYNNGQHTREVVEGGVRYTLRSREVDPRSFTLEDVVLVVIAALGHDLVQGHGRVLDERIAAGLTVKLMQLLMPETYTEAHGKAVYDGIIATTFVNGAQAVDANSPNVKPMKALAVADLFHLAHSVWGVEGGIRCALKDLSTPGGRFWADLPGRVHEVRPDAGQLSVIGYLKIIEDDPVLRAMFVEQAKGQIGFTKSHQYPDPRVDEWFTDATRQANVAFLEREVRLLEEGLITVPEYYRRALKRASEADG